MCEECPYAILDNLGYVNCLALDSSVGLCLPELCPRMVRPKRVEELPHPLGSLNQEVIYSWKREPP